MDRVRATDKNGKPTRPTRAGIPGTERTLCLRLDNGELVWKDEYPCPYTVSYPSGPRATPLISQGRVYTLGAMGHLRCLDAKTGKRIWAKELMKDYGLDLPPVGGFAAHPLLDGDRLYCLVGGDGSAVVAVHKDNGKELWRALKTEEIGYSPPMIFRAGRKRQLMIWLSESINSLDPETGHVYWSLPYPASGRPKRLAVNIATVRRADDLLFLSTYYHGPMMLKLSADKPAATVLWATKKANGDPRDGEASLSATSIYTLMSTPVIKGGHVYGVSANGELTCLKASDGKKLWQTYAATNGKETDCGTAFLIPVADRPDSKRFLIFNDQGDLILASLTPTGYHEIDRAHVLEPSQKARGRMVVWSHPACAQRCVFAVTIRKSSAFLWQNDVSVLCQGIRSRRAFIREEDTS